MNTRLISMNARSRFASLAVSVLAAASLAAAAAGAPPRPSHSYDGGDAAAPVTPISQADFNQDGRVNNQDIIDFMAAWYAGSRAADTNQDGTVGVSDIWKFMNLYFAATTGKR